MIPCDQTEFYDKEKGTTGNCMQACFASLLELPLDSVPHFALEKTGWFKAIYDFLATFNLSMYQTPKEMQINFPHLVCGPSPRGISHMVIYNGNRLFFDPHPSRAGVLEIDERQIIIPKNLAQQVRITA